jgi:predicted Zn-dependent protease with MMP-like domain
MIEIPDTQWHELVDRAFDSLPAQHRDAVKNVAIVLEDDPSEVQREELKLRGDQTLLGLYSGVSLPLRHGRTDLPPDVITLFKNPLLAESWDEAQLYENIRHTLWHEVAHYFGLNHEQIHRLEHES